MHIFPVTKASFEENDEYISEIIGYRAVSSDGRRVLATGESVEEATEKALVAMYLDESNPTLKKIKLGRRMFGQKIPASATK